MNTRKMNARKMNARKLLVSILMLVSVLLAACAPAATPSPTAIPPTTVPPTVVSTIAPASTLTTFSPKTLKLPVTFRYGSEWHIAEEYSDVVSLTSTGLDGYFSFIDPKSIKIAGPAAPFSAIPFPADFVTWIQSHGLFQVVKTQMVVVGGFQGTQIDANATPACGTKTNWLFLAHTGWNCGDGVHYRFIYLDDVNGEQLLIMLEGASSAQEFMSKVDATQQILDTVVFSKPTAAADTTFSPKTFNLPMTLSYGPEWHVAEDFADEFELVGGTQAYDGVELVFIFVKDAKIADPSSAATMPWPDDFVTYLHSNQYLEVGEPMPITVGGVNGVQIDVSNKNIGQKRTFIGLKSTGWLYLDADQSWRFIILDDVNGQRLLIGTTEAPEGFSLATELAQKVIDSVVFTK